MRSFRLLLKQNLNLKIDMIKVSFYKRSWLRLFYSFMGTLFSNFFKIFLAPVHIINLQKYILDLVEQKNVVYFFLVRTLNKRCVTYNVKIA